MPSARQAVGESAPLSAFQKALAGEAVKVRVRGAAFLFGLNDCSF